MPKKNKGTNIELLEYKFQQLEVDFKKSAIKTNSALEKMLDAITKISVIISEQKNIKQDVRDLEIKVETITTFSIEVMTLTKVLKYVFWGIGFIFVAGISIIAYIITHSDFLTKFIGTISNV